MSVNRKKQFVLLLLVVVIAGLLSILGTAAADSPVTPFPPDSSPYGQTYDEWAEEFWLWVGRVKVKDIDDHPLLAVDPYDVECKLGQQGKVWFLGGIYGGAGTESRTCKVPAGKALFFPIVNILCSPLAHDPPDPAILLTCAVTPGDVYGFEYDMYPVSATIDGADIPDLEDYYVLSEATFEIGRIPDQIRDPNIFGADAGTVEPAASSGYYLMLPPLSEGSHIINFVGVIAVEGTPYPTDMTYFLEVVDD